MSKIGSAETKCPCDATLQVRVVKPAHFRTGVSKAQCPNCQSRFLVRTDLKRGTTPRELSVSFEILHLSEKAREGSRSGEEALCSVAV
jgi:hypothetical protein